jgi:hypothetical protein
MMLRRDGLVGRLCMFCSSSDGSSDYTLGKSYEGLPAKEFVFGSRAAGRRGGEAIPGPVVSLVEERAMRTHGVGARWCRLGRDVGLGCIVFPRAPWHGVMQSGYWLDVALSPGVGHVQPRWSLVRVGSSVTCARFGPI